MMNPIGILTFYLFRTVGLGDVGRWWFEGRTLRRCLISGPGIFVLNGEVLIENCTLRNCDFIIATAGASSATAHLLHNTTLKNCVIDHAAFVVTPVLLGKFKASMEEDANVFEGTLVPAINA